MGFHLFSSVQVSRSFSQVSCLAIFHRQTFLCRFVLVCCLAGLVGCAGFRKVENRASNEGVEASSGAKKKSKSKVKADPEASTARGQNSKANSDVNDGEQFVNAQVQWEIIRDGEALPKELWESYAPYVEFQGWLEEWLTENKKGRVVKDPAVADLVLDLKIRLESHPDFGHIGISALTLFVVPTIARDTYRMDYQVLDKGGAVVRSGEIRSTVKEWVQILLLPLTPFAFPTTVQKRAFNDAFQILIP